MHLKNLSIPKNLRTLKTNFEEADGLGIGKHKNAGVFFDLLTIFFKLQIFYGVKLAIVAYVSGEIN